MKKINTNKMNNLNYILSSKYINDPDFLFYLRDLKKNEDDLITYLFNKTNDKWSDEFVSDLNKIIEKRKLGKINGHVFNLGKVDSFTTDKVINIILYLFFQDGSYLNLILFNIINRNIDKLSKIDEYLKKNNITKDFFEIWFLVVDKKETRDNIFDLYSFIIEENFSSHLRFLYSNSVDKEEMYCVEYERAYILYTMLSLTLINILFLREKYPYEEDMRSLSDTLSYVYINYYLDMLKIRKMSLEELRKELDLWGNVNELIGFIYILQHVGTYFSDVMSFGALESGKIDVFNSDGEINKKAVETVKKGLMICKQNEYTKEVYKKLKHLL